MLLILLNINYYFNIVVLTKTRKRRDPLNEGEIVLHQVDLVVIDQHQRRDVQ